MSGDVAPDPEPGVGPVAGDPSDSGDARDVAAAALDAALAELGPDRAQELLELMVTELLTEQDPETSQ